jgi:type VI secretion system protein ImpF
MLVLSILERLIDEHPNHSHEVVKAEGSQLKELHRSICRDLEDLLNTRCPELMWPKTWQALTQSLINYGISDICGKKLDTATMQENFCMELSHSISCLETRLKDVTVQLLQPDKILDGSLYLRIEALLSVDADLGWLIFDSILDPGTRSFAVVEVR